MDLYEKRIIAFVDILGFKNIVLNSITDNKEQKRILKAMKIIRDVKELYGHINNERFSRRLGIYVTTFSDSAVISYPLSLDGGLFWVLFELTNLQIELLRFGFFIRGGITIGYAYHNEYNVFGPAMVEAYELESKKAKYPRVILTDDTLRLGIQNSPIHQNEHDLELINCLIKMDTDGFYYLDYLAFYQETDMKVNEYCTMMKEIRATIVASLNSSNIDNQIYRKYLWMLNYWNLSVCPENNKKVVEGNLELRIDPNEIPYR